MRQALRESRRDSNTSPKAEQPLVLVALSGGADSLALAAATAFEAPKSGWRAGAVVVDHGLQRGSAEVAARAADEARGLGLDPVLVRRVEVPTTQQHSAQGGDNGGPEAMAREARYLALAAARLETGAEMVLTAHTSDDQAEQVLLALARGSGTRAVAGIPPKRDEFLRPFLEIDRATTEAACAAQGLVAWVDPHNFDDAFTRVRVRQRVLPVLEAELGAGVAANLARSARLAREDADALDELAVRIMREAIKPRQHSRQPDEAVSLSIDALAHAPAALRQRVIRLVARECFQAHFSQTHTLAVSALVTDWHGQGAIHAPGVTVQRQHDVLVFRAHRATD